MFNKTADLRGHPEYTHTTATQRLRSLSSPGVRRENTSAQRALFIIATEFPTGRPNVQNGTTKFNTGSA